MELQKVEVWIYRRRVAGRGPVDQVLVLKMIPVRGGVWQPVTGSVERGEELRAAAEREALEETGIGFLRPAESLDRDFTFQARGNTYREYGFALEAPPADAPVEVKLDPHEHEDYRWVSPEEALKLMRFPENAAMLKVLLERLNKEEKE